MVYDRKRMLMLASFWFLLAMVVLVFQPPLLYDGPSGIEDVEALNTNCPEPPCMFPAQKYDSGILMGVEYLYATTVTFNNADTITSSHPHKGDVRVAHVGANDLNPAVGMFIHKTWKYDNEFTGKRENAYLWINASMNGSKDPNDYDSSYDHDGSFIISVDQDGNYVDNGCTGPRDCELWADVTEIGAERLEGRGCAFWICMNMLGEEYWVTTPWEDTCGLSLCLQAADQYGEWTEFYWGIFRVHGIRALRDTDNGHDAALQMPDVYMEMRHGTGHDRIYEGFSKPTDGRSFSMPFFCKGNPETSLGCPIRSEDRYPPPPGPIQSYGDPYGG